MKKTLVLVAVLAFFIGGCKITNTVSGAGIPEIVSHIEFWNGGTMIGEYENARIVIKTVYRSVALGSNIDFYVYEVTSNGKTETIIDSEALSAKYW
jgi:hypothetical protein